MKLLLAAVATTLGVSGTGPPPGPPPQVGGVTSFPPPAWIEAGTVRRWLAYGSYCWRTSCVDMIPNAQRDDLPLVRVRRGRVIRVHLGFRPRSAVVRVGATVVSRTTSWKAKRSGFVLVDVRGTKGSAGYVARLVVRP
jgi:hypothetical protein